MLFRSGDSAFQERFASVKAAKKATLSNLLRERMGLRIDPSALFDTQIKRIHEYKRQLLNIIEAVALYDQIRSHPEKDWVPRVKLFGGKAAPSYHNAKLIIKLANDVARAVNHDPAVQGTRHRLVVVLDEGMLGGSERPPEHGQAAQCGTDEGASSQRHRAPIMGPFVV